MKSIIAHIPRFLVRLRHLHPLLKVLLFILVAELVLQLVLPDLRGYTYFYIEDWQDERSNWEEDAELFWVPPDRFASLHERTQQTKPENRLLFFGGSVVYGYYPHPSFTDSLQDRLAADSDRSNLTALNYAVPGYTTQQSKILAQRVLAQFEARLIFVSHGSNDIMRMNFPDSHIYLLNHGWGKQTLHHLNKSKLFVIYRRLLLRFRPDSGSRWHDMQETGLSRVSAEEFRENLQVFVDLARAKSSPLVLMNQENVSAENRRRQEPYFAVMKELADRYDHVTYIDARSFLHRYFGSDNPDYFHQEDEEKNIFIDLCHYNSNGARLIGNFLYKELVRLGLLD